MGGEVFLKLNDRIYFLQTKNENLDNLFTSLTTRHKDEVAKAQANMKLSEDMLNDTEKELRHVKESFDNHKIEADSHIRKLKKAVKSLEKNLENNEKNYSYELLNIVNCLDAIENQS